MDQYQKAPTSSRGTHGPVVSALTEKSFGPTRGGRGTLVRHAFDLGDGYHTAGMV